MAIRRICRIEIENFRGITESRIDVPRNGLKLSGDEGAGKTSHLDAIAAALRGTDLGVEVIRRGAEKTSLLVGFDDGTTVKRSITAKGVGQPTVVNGDAKIMKPQTWLQERLGLSTFDVISFIGSKPADRVRMLQEAVPCTVTIERLRQWVPSLESFDCSGHGLEVVRRLHKIAYDKRTAANAAAKAASAEHERLSREASASAAAVDVSLDAISPAEAFEQQQLAERHASTLRAAIEAAKAHEARTVGTREKIAKLRADAALCARSENEWTAAGVAVDSERSEVARAKAKVAEIERALEEARAAVARSEQSLSAATQRFADIEQARRDAGKLRDQANELEATLAAAAPGAPTMEDIAKADADIARARELLAVAERVEVARAANAARAAAAERAKAANAEADRLDGIVKALATEAPRALMAESGGIDGLEIEGEAIRVDGIAIDSLSSGQQLRLAVSIAKRLNKAPILIVDHLEHLAPSRRDDFLREACAGGWQVFATVVDDGALAIEGLEFEETAQAAE